MDNTSSRRKSNLTKKNIDDEKHGSTDNNNQDKFDKIETVTSTNLCDVSFNSFIGLVTDYNYKSINPNDLSNFDSNMDPIKDDFDRRTSFSFSQVMSPIKSRMPETEIIPSYNYNEEDSLASSKFRRNLFNSKKQEQQKITATKAAVVDNPKDEVVISPKIFKPPKNANNSFVNESDKESPFSNYKETEDNNKKQKIIKEIEKFEEFELNLAAEFQKFYKKVIINII